MAVAQTGIAGPMERCKKCGEVLMGWLDDGSPVCSNCDIIRIRD